MKNPFFTLLILLITVFSSCQSEQAKKQYDAIPENTNKITVTEAIPGSTYTYLNGSNGTNNIWVAIRNQPIEIGKTYYYTDALEMKNFHSKELNRDFPSIFFLNSISEQAIQGKAIQGETKMSTSPMMKNPAKKIEVKMNTKAGVTNLSELFENKNKFEGKDIIVQGKVAKFNKNILGKNWIHIQDGTDFNGEFDLTITSNEIVSVGETIEIKGKIAINKDFGAGYTYDIIMENATLQ